MNYEAERAMNQKRLRMEGESGHGVVQGNGLPLNYMDNGHQIPYQPYASAYNTHYPPPDAFAAYGPPPPGGYAPQNLSYAPPAHQNYAHHQSFPPQQPPQAQLHMQSHMVQGYGDVAMHKAAWPHQPHLLPPLDSQKPLDIKHLKPEIKLEPSDTQKRPHPDNEMMGGEMDQPKIKIKTDIFKPDDVPHRIDADKPHDTSQAPAEVVQKPIEHQLNKDVTQPGVEIKPVEKPAELNKVEVEKSAADSSRPDDSSTPLGEKKDCDVKPEGFSSPDRPRASVTPGKSSSSGSEPKKRGRPKGSTNKPKPPGSSPGKLVPNMSHTAGQPRGPPATPVKTAPIGRPRAMGYQYAVRPFRKDFSGIQFRRRWSDDCLDSAHIPNEVFFGDVPVSMEVLFNYYDANAEREKLATQAAQIAAQKAAAAKLAAAKLQARGLVAKTTSEVSSTTDDQPTAKAGSSKLAATEHPTRGLGVKTASEVTTVDSSSTDESSEEGSDSEESEDDQPLKKTPGRPKGKWTGTPKPKTGTPGKRGRPPVPPELRVPGIMDMKKFCKAAGIRFDYKKLVEGCTKNKERVSKMMELLVAAGLEGKPTLEKCQGLKQAKLDKRSQDKRAKKEAKVKPEPAEPDSSTPRRVTRGQTGVKPRQKIVISSDEEDDTPDARRTLSKLRSMLPDDDSN